MVVLSIASTHKYCRCVVRAVEALKVIPLTDFTHYMGPSMMVSEVEISMKFFFFKNFCKFFTNTKNALEIDLDII